jgi:hypothetical protein
VFGETGEIDGNLVCDSEVFVFDETGEIDGNFVCDNVLLVGKTELYKMILQ